MYPARFKVQKAARFRRMQSFAGGGQSASLRRDSVRPDIDFTRRRFYRKLLLLKIFFYQTRPKGYYTELPCVIKALP